MRRRCAVIKAVATADGNGLFDALFREPGAGPPLAAMAAVSEAAVPRQGLC